jgi:hypothetical protein
MDRTARGVNAIAWEHVSPDTIKEKTDAAFNEVEPFVFAFVVGRSARSKMPLLVPVMPVPPSWSGPFQVFLRLASMKQTWQSIIEIAGPTCRSYRTPSRKRSH